MTQRQGSGERMVCAEITELIEAGAPLTQLVFGSAGETVGAESLCLSGATHISTAADSPAVATIMTNDRPTVELVLGAIMGRAEIVSLPIPTRSGSIEEYLALIRAACAQRGIADVVARDDIASLLNSAGISAIPHSALRTRPISQPCADGFRLTQFSSGSTGRPKAIQLSAAQLGANVSAILERIDPHPGDAVVSWLPLSHDMGLIGMLLASIAGMADGLAGPGHVVLLDPQSFLRKPALWLDALHEWRGTITAAPDFGYRLAHEYGGATLRDLSRLRCAIVGGEIVRASTLECFTDRFASSGVKLSAICPAYGMAEVGLAVSLTHPAETWRERVVSNAALAESAIVTPNPKSPHDRAGRLVSSGYPLHGYEVVSTAEADVIGGLSVRGPSVGRDAFSGLSLSEKDGWFTTGDVGFIDDGFVYVCGRCDDYISANGRNIHLPTIESAVGAVPGVRPGRAAAFGTHEGDWYVLVEAARGQSGTAEELVRAVRLAIVQSASIQPTDVLMLRRGHLPMTSSGKLQRNEVRRLFLRGEFDIAAAKR